MKRTRRVCERVEFPLPVASHVNEFGIAKNRQVARDLRLAFTEDLAQVANADLLLCLKEVQDAQTRRIRESAEDVGRYHIHKNEYDRPGRVCQAGGGRNRIRSGSGPTRDELSVGRESLFRPCEGPAVQTANVGVAERLKDQHA